MQWGGQKDHQQPHWRYFKTFRAFIFQRYMQNVYYVGFAGCTTECENDSGQKNARCGLGRAENKK